MAETTRRGHWTTPELERLRELYLRCPEAKVAELLRRSVPAVRRRALQLLAPPRTSGAWSADADDRLRLAYGLHPLPRLALLLGRNQREVAARAALLRRGRRTGPWRREELARLRRCYGNRSDRDLEVCLSRPARQIAEQAARLRLAKDKRFAPRRGRARPSMPRWSAADVHWLVANYPHRGNLELAQHLRRSVTSVANKANQLGLRKGGELLTAVGRGNVAVRYARR